MNKSIEEIFKEQNLEFRVMGPITIASINNNLTEKEFIFSITNKDHYLMNELYYNKKFSTESQLRSWILNNIKTILEDCNNIIKNKTYEI